MPFNAELACKALDQRISGLERAVESLRKATQGADPVAGQVKGQGERLSKLENVVKVLGENRSANKVDAMEKSVKALYDAKLIDEKSFRKQLEDNDNRREDNFKKEQERMKQTVQADIDKKLAQMQKQVEEAQKQVDSAKLESRLQVLEAKVHAALGRG